MDVSFSASNPTSFSTTLITAGPCQGIDYFNIDYGTSLHFATIGSDNGHDGNTALPFFNHPEVINDFAYRAIHVEAIIGKAIVEAYYSDTPSKSYFLGCSSGGRQAFQSALLYPDDFDGIVGGAPAVDWNHLVGWGELLGKSVGATDPELPPSFIPGSLWLAISQEILNQCDDLDGLVDGIISEPDECDFNPVALVCAEGSTEGCLMQPQIDALNKIYNPVYGTRGQLLFPRYDPGAEGALESWALFNGSSSPYIDASSFAFLSLSIYLLNGAFGFCRIGLHTRYITTPRTPSRTLVSRMLNMLTR